MSIAWKKDIDANYLPVKIHIKEQPKIFERFGAQCARVTAM
jgi:hypothetical protein